MSLLVRRRPGPAPDPGRDASEHETTRREGWLLAVCCVAQFLVILDLSIVNVALPAIQASLGFSSIDLQWVVDAYAIVFAGFLMVGGRATDRFGQRRALVVALAGFSIASLIAGLAPTQNVLIGARALQGLSGALMAAASLAAITATFPAGPARHRAIGLWSAMNGAGGATGVLLGGVLTDAFGWRWIFLINPPVGAAAAVGAYLLLTDDSARGRDAGRVDLGGALTLTGGLIALVYGIVAAGYLGWGAAGSLGPIALGVLLLAAFLFLEARVVAAPLVPLRALTTQLRRANLVVLLFSAALFPMWYVSSLYLQQVLALSPLEAGLCFLPMALTIMVAARRAGRLVGLFGARTVLTGGLVLMAGGLLLLARIGTSGSAVWYVVLPGVVVALGIALSIVPSTIAATQGARPEQAGLASGLVNTSRQVGGALGIALLVSLASQRTSHLIGQNKAVPTALTDGFRLAYLVGAVLCLVAALVARFMLATPVETPRRASRFAVGVAVLLAAFAAVDAVFAGSPGAPIGAYTTHGAYAFVSAPALHPPKIRVEVAAAAAALSHGYVMTANFYDLSEPADRRPERAADPRQAAPAGLVPTGAEGRRRLQPQRPDLPRRAGAGVVAGRDHEHRRDRERRDRRRRPPLPHARDAARHRRLDRDTARPRDPRRRRLGDREPQRADEPDALRRRQQRRARRLGRPGVQPEDREAPLQLGCLRPHPALGVVCAAADERLPVGCLPRQLDRPRGQWEAARLDARHVGGLPRRSRDRADRVDARREGLELPFRPERRTSSGSTTSSPGRAAT